MSIIPLVSFSIVVTQIQGFEYLIHKGSVLRNDPSAESADDPIIGVLQVQWHKGSIFLLHGDNTSNETIQSRFFREKHINSAL